ncbi:acid protease [Auricularia subglabra TFB-10046 SS5]|nr:acid protease [Auricularia subglabra TFB-10046 SS5]
MLTIAATLSTFLLSAQAVVPPLPTGASAPDTDVFDQAMMTLDRARVLAKYQKAGTFLAGVDLSPVPDFTNIANISDDLSSFGMQHAQPLTNFGGDSFYYGPVAIGTPGQVLNVDVDTGSADLWVQSGCPDCTSAQFQTKRSKTYKSANKRFSIQYGSGSATGSLAVDTVSIAGVTVKEQYFGVVNRPSNDFKGTPSSGLIGMAFSSIATSGKPTFFENAIAGGLSPFFSVHLTRGAVRGSEVCLGCYDGSKTSSPVSWMPVTSKTYWATAMNGFVINRQPVTLNAAIYAAIDTGTTLVYVPASLAQQIYQRIPGAVLTPDGYYTVSCADVPTMRVALVLNGLPYAIDMRDFNLGRVSHGSPRCVAGVLGLADGFPNNLAIVGDEFLKSWYSTYDYSNGARVGLSRSSNQES